MLQTKCIAIIITKQIQVFKKTVSIAATIDRENQFKKYITCQFSYPVKHFVHNALADGEVTSGVVVGGIFLAWNQLLRVEELAVGSSSDLIYKNANFLRKFNKQNGSGTLIQPQSRAHFHKDV